MALLMNLSCCLSVVSLLLCATSIAAPTDENEVVISNNFAIQQMATSHRKLMMEALEAGNYDEAIGLVDEQLERASVDAPSDFALHVSLQYDKLSCLREAKRRVELLFEAQRLRSLFTAVDYPTKTLDLLIKLVEGELARRSPYDMLQLEPGATGPAMRKAHLKLGKLLGKTSNLDEHSKDYLAKLKERVDEAYAMLKYD